MKRDLRGHKFCPLLKCHALLEARVDRLGRAVIFCPNCDRRRSGRCVDCEHPTTGKSWRCETCKDRIRHEHDRRHRLRYRDRERKQDRDRWRKMTPAQREQRRARRRELRSRHREKFNARNREWTAKHRIWFLAYQRRYNATRVEKKRAGARARYYQLHPTRPDPHCVECGAKIEWTPRHGRPALRCPDHNPWKKAG